jgi:hypothetical protein
MTENQIESMPARLEGDYCQFRELIRERLSEALGNGDAVAEMQTMLGDFMRAMSHTLGEYDAPTGTLEQVTSIMPH